MRRRRLAPLAAAAAALTVLAAVLVGRAVVHVPEPAGSARRDGPPPLRLTAPAPTAVDPVRRRVELSAGTRLPARRPPDTPIYFLRSGPAPAATVRRLAVALGLPTPRREPAGWVADAGARTLEVRDLPGRPWRLAATGTSPGCAAEARKCWPAELPPPTAPTSAAPSDAVTRRAAAPVLAAVGLSVRDARVHDGVVTVHPSVGPPVDRPGRAGPTTTGVASVVTVGGDGQIRSARGWLLDPRPGPAYPVVSAARGLSLLRDRPLPDACPAGSGCTDAAPVRVTGARLGLAVRYAGRTPLLVPAWLFTVAGSADPPAQLAVDPAYLRPGSGPG